MHETDIKRKAYERITTPMYGIGKIRISSFILIVSVILVGILYAVLDFDCAVLKILVCVSIIMLLIYELIKIKGQKCLSLMLFMMLYLVYSFTMSRYFSIKRTDSIVIRYTENMSERDFGKAIYLMLVWFTFLIVASNILGVNKNIKSNEITKTKMGGKPIGIICVFATMITLIFGFDFSVIGSGHRGGVSAAFEYAIIFFAIGYYYAAQMKYIRWLLNGMILLYAALAFLAGERIGVLQIIFVPVMLYYGEKLTSRTLVWGAIIGIVFMNFIGAYRESFMGGTVNLEDFCYKLANEKMAFDGADHALYTSLTMQLMAQRDSILFRVQHGVQYALCIFLGDKGWLQHYTFKFYPHSYGGYAPQILYYYYGWIGVAVGAMIIGKLIKTAQKEIANADNSIIKDYWSILLVILASTTFRWFMYSYILAFRTLLFYTIVYFIVIITSRKRI